MCLHVGCLQGGGFQRSSWVSRTHPPASTATNRTTPPAPTPTPNAAGRAPMPPSRTSLARPPSPSQPQTPQPPQPNAPQCPPPHLVVARPDDLPARVHGRHRLLAAYLDRGHALRARAGGRGFRSGGGGLEGLLWVCFGAPPPPHAPPPGKARRAAGQLHGRSKGGQTHLVEAQGQHV